MFSEKKEKLVRKRIEESEKVGNRRIHIYV